VVGQVGELSLDLELQAPPAVGVDGPAVGRGTLGRGDGRRRAAAAGGHGLRPDAGAVAGHQGERLGLRAAATTGNGDRPGEHGQQGHAGHHGPATLAGRGGGGHGLGVDHGLGFDHVSSSSGVATSDGRKKHPVPRYEKKNLSG
jgi:hypothetical protein